MAQGVPAGTPWPIHRDNAAGQSSPPLPCRRRRSRRCRGHPRRQCRSGHGRNLHRCRCCFRRGRKLSRHGSADSFPMRAGTPFRHCRRRRHARPRPAIVVAGVMPGRVHAVVVAGVMPGRVHAVVVAGIMPGCVHAIVVAGIIPGRVHAVVVARFGAGRHVVRGLRRILSRAARLGEGRGKADHIAVRRERKRRQRQDRGQARHAGEHGRAPRAQPIAGEISGNRPIEDVLHE